jgi:hypothetical protein
MDNVVAYLQTTQNAAVPCYDYLARKIGPGSKQLRIVLLAEIGNDREVDQYK